MLNSLVVSTRPDILPVVHQYAMFLVIPKLSYKRTLKRILRYLEYTKNIGLILKPHTSKGALCYVDADFTVGFSKEPCEGTISVYSCTGYAFLSFSTLEAKCVALS